MKAVAPNAMRRCDLTIDRSIISREGHITLTAQDDIYLNAAISTTGVGTVYLLASNSNPTDAVGPEVDGINLNGSITSGNGDVLLESSSDIRQTATITSTNGDVGLIAARDVLHTDSGDITSTRGDALVNAGRNWTLSF